MNEELAVLERLNLHNCNNFSNYRIKNNNNNGNIGISLVCFCH